MPVIKFPYDHLDGEGYREWMKSQDHNDHFDFFGKDMPKACFFNLGTYLLSSDFGETNLSKSQFQNNNCLWKVNFTKANLNDADFTKSNCKNSTFYEANLEGANFLNCNLSAVNFDNSINLSKAKNLEYTETNSETTINHLTIPWYDRYFSWEMISTIGKLPLFGASYTALIAMPIIFSLIAHYNKNIQSLKSGVSLNTDPFLNSLKVILENLKLYSLPTGMLWFFSASLLLAIASTIYSIACPKRIKTFNREEWQYDNKEHLLHYLAHSWKYRLWRLVAGITYLTGGSIALIFILIKLWSAGIYIIDNT